MTAMISYTFLQHYWWVIVSLLASLLVFLMFVQGGQGLIFSLPGNESQKKMIINAMGRKWEFTFTTLVTFGGAFFASFPLFYATSFGGAYWLWMAILFSFTIQAVAYEFRSRPANFLGTRTFDIFLYINGMAGPFLIGAAVGTFFTGSFFTLDHMNNVTWATPFHGLEALVIGKSLALGFAVLFLARSNGLLYLINAVEDEDLLLRSQKKLIISSIAFLLFFLIFLFSLLLTEGFAVRNDGTIVTEKFKYLNNLIQMPLVLVILLAGVCSLLYGIGISLFRRSRKGIWFSGAGTVLAVLALLLIAGFNNTPFYPSLHDRSSSLTIFNASSSKFTLNTMFWVSFLIPFVAAYIWYAWKSINIKRITDEELREGTGHVY
jgi:cytochrome d ubiquinol oxidase subunit II